MGAGGIRPGQHHGRQSESPHHPRPCRFRTGRHEVLYGLDQVLCDRCSGRILVPAISEPFWNPGNPCRKLNGGSLTSIITGIAWHMVGAASAASFYAPISKVKRWTWESTWAVAGIFSWVLLPICVSAILLPDMRWRSTLRLILQSSSRHFSLAPCGESAT